MQLVGCDRIHEDITRNRTGATTPRERIPKRRMKATHNNGGYSAAFIAAEAQRGMHLIRKPAKLTGTRHELCTCGGSPPDLVWVAQAASATPSTLNKTGRDTAETKVKTERRPVMEEMLCAMALKSTNGRQTHHT
jgi:hypothetical protein